MTVVGLIASACGGGGSGADSALTFWHGYTDAEAKWMNAAIAEWNGQHPDIQIKPVFVNNDDALKKLTVALQGDRPPDISYQFAVSLPQVAAAHRLVDLTQWVQQPDLNWDDFIPGA